MNQVQAYIGIRGARNINEMADIPAGKMNLFNTHVFQPVHMECRIKADQVVRPALAERRAWRSRRG